MASRDDTDEDDELPEKWLDEDALSSNYVQKSKEHNEKYVQLYTKHLSKKSVFYQMKNFPRGIVMIINNEKFPGSYKREGSGIDCQMINAVFSDLYFIINIHNDLTMEEMETKLVESSKQDYSNHDCFILFILSHGDKGVVYGIDHISYSISQITTLFCNNKSLVGKPKLFFIQACQGGKYDRGKTLAGEQGTVGHSETKATEQAYFTNSDRGNTSDEKTEGVPKIPTKADVFLSISTEEGYVSFRDPKNGSWYIQAIGYVFRRFAYKFDLNHLMILVNNLVSKAEAKPQQHKQVATVKSTLTKQLYFFPRLYEPYVTLKQQYDQEKQKRQSLESLVKTKDELIVSLRHEKDKEKKRHQLFKILVQSEQQLDRAIEESHLVEAHGRDKCTLRRLVSPRLKFLKKGRRFSSGMVTQHLSSRREANPTRHVEKVDCERNKQSVFGRSDVPHTKDQFAGSPSIGLVASRPGVCPKFINPEGSIKISIGRRRHSSFDLTEETLNAVDESIVNREQLIMKRKFIEGLSKCPNESYASNCKVPRDEKSDV